MCKTLSNYQLELAFFSFLFVCLFCVCFLLIFIQILTRSQYAIKVHLSFQYTLFNYDLVKTAFRFNQAWKQTSFVIVLSFPSAFRLRQTGIHWIVSDGVISGVGRKWKHSDSSDTDSVAYDAATTLIFLFSLGHKRSYESAYDSYSDSVAIENQP